MHGLKEEKILLRGKSVSEVLAQDLIRRIPCGKVVVVTEDPRALLSVVRKRWLKLIRKMHIQRARLLHTPQALELSVQIEVLERLRFTALLPEDNLEADITFGSVDNLIKLGPICQVLYLAHELPREKQFKITAWMPIPTGTVIYIYEK